MQPVLESCIKNFQGVVCSCLDDQRTVSETINTILDLTVTSYHHDIKCYELKLENKYYKTTLHLFDHDELRLDKRNEETILSECQAIIIFCSGEKITLQQLDSKVEQLASVCGEPRVIINESSNDSAFSKKLLDWSIQNGYDLLDYNEEDIKEQLINSLSAYKWKLRVNPNNAELSRTSTDTTVIQQNPSSLISVGEATGSTGKSTETKVNNLTDDVEKPQLDDQLMKKLQDFDHLLSKLSAYRDRPELRGNPNDKNIEEIAHILSGLLDGEDVDEFLDSED